MTPRYTKRLFCFLRFLFSQFTENVFALLDRNSDGIIDINEFIGSLDRLEW